MPPSELAAREGSDLLKKALAAPVNVRMSKTAAHDVDVAIAWAKGELGYSQVASAIAGDLKTACSSVYSWLAQSLRDAVKQGRLTEVPNVDE